MVAEIKGPISVLFKSDIEKAAGGDFRKWHSTLSMVIHCTMTRVQETAFRKLREGKVTEKPL